MNIELLNSILLKKVDLNKKMSDLDNKFPQIRVGRSNDILWILVDTGQIIFKESYARGKGEAVDKAYAKLFETFIVDLIDKILYGE